MLSPPEEDQQESREGAQPSPATYAWPPRRMVPCRGPRGVQLLPLLPGLLLALLLLLLLPIPLRGATHSEDSAELDGDNYTVSTESPVCSTHSLTHTHTHICARAHSHTHTQTSTRPLTHTHMPAWHTFTYMLRHRWTFSLQNPCLRTHTHK